MKDRTCSSIRLPTATTSTMVSLHLIFQLLLQAWTTINEELWMNIDGARINSLTCGDDTARTGYLGLGSSGNLFGMNQMEFYKSSWREELACGLAGIQLELLIILNRC